MKLHPHIRHGHRHANPAVRFAWWNFVVNGIFTVVFFAPVMALSFIDKHLGASVAWVSFLSIWALGATHAGAAIAAYAAIHAAEGNENDDDHLRQ